MIQFNLLPDVKLNFVKTEKLKHTIITFSILAAALSIAIMLILVLIVDVVQKSQINSLNNQLTSSISTLQGTPNLNKILTLQSELNSLGTLHNEKPVITRLPNFLQELIPSNISISDFTITFTSTTASSTASNSMTMTGTTSNLANVNQFADILKLTSYTTSASSTPKNAFTGVVLSNVSYSSGQGASFTISASFDPLIFADPTSTVKLILPSDAVTRSTTVESQDLFVNPTPPANGQAGN